MRNVRPDWGSVVVAITLMVTAGQASASEGGLEIFPNIYKLTAMIVLFLLLIVPVNSLLLKPLLAVLDERRDRIAGARERAEKVSREAGEVLETYKQAVARTREDAEQGRRATLDEARGVQARQVSEERAAAEQRLEQARGEVDAALESARQGLRADAETLAREAAARILGRELS